MESCSNGSYGDGGSNNAMILDVVIIKLMATVVEAILTGLALVVTTIMASVEWQRLWQCSQ